MKKQPIIKLQPDGRPALPAPDPRKGSPRIGQRLLPQVPSVAPAKLPMGRAGRPKTVRTRHTARPR
jgi:hypothetical protein